jgi:uncharacterized phage protein (TIGR01671 family)
LFRGKDLSGNWYYGLLAEVKTNKMQIPMGKYISNSVGASYAYAIRPETVCEYTGLTDKNGKKIFEGDIVKTKQYGKDNGKGANFNDYDIFQVVFKEGVFWIDNLSRRFTVSDVVEIIGNIHDNPKLLK